MNDTVKDGKLSRWRTLGLVVLFMLCCAVSLVVTSPFVPTLSDMWSELCLGLITSLIALGLTLIFVHSNRIALKEIGVAICYKSPWRSLIGFSIGIFLVGLWALVSAASGCVHWIAAPKTGFLGTASALTAYLALSCREELAFHGYPLRRLEAPLGMWGAQLFVAFVFVVEHRLGGSPWPQAVFGAGVGSLLFGMAAIATRGLAVPIGMHAAWNFGQWALGFKGQPGLLKAVVADGQGPRAEFLAMIAYVAVMGSATVGFWMWHRYITARTSGN
jgi:CAAX protease family protein